jgi:hypothetical protein
MLWGIHPHPAADANTDPRSRPPPPRHRTYPRCDSGMQPKQAPDRSRAMCSPAQSAPGDPYVNAYARDAHSGFLAGAVLPRLGARFAAPGTTHSVDPLGAITQSGILDAMGVAHLLGDGAPALARLGPRYPLLPAERLLLFGFDPIEVGPDTWTRSISVACPRGQSPGSRATRPRRPQQRSRRWSGWLIGCSVTSTLVVDEINRCGGWVGVGRRWLGAAAAGFAARVVGLLRR